MKTESTLVYEVWEVVRDHIPAAKRVDSAISIIRKFIDFGFEREDFLDACEEDDVIKTAFNLVFENEEDEDEEEPDYYED